MPITKYRNDIESPSIPRTFSEMMDNFFNESLSLGDRLGFTPGIDILENDKQFVIQVTLPGIKKEDIKIDLEDRMLTISGERKHEKEEKNVKYHLVESRYGKFERSFTLPPNAEPDSLDARYENGILKLTLTKSEKSLSKQIQVK